MLVKSPGSLMSDSGCAFLMSFARKQVKLNRFQKIQKGAPVCVLFKAVGTSAVCYHHSYGSVTSVTGALFLGSVKP